LAVYSQFASDEVKVTAEIEMRCPVLHRGSALCRDRKLERQEMKRFMTRRTEGRHLLNACRRTWARIEEWRQIVASTRPLDESDNLLLDDWVRWSFHREVDAWMLLCPAPFVRRLKQAADGTWSRTLASEAAIAVAAATHAAGFRRKRHRDW
jgi:hypothetical protein